MDDHRIDQQLTYRQPHFASDQHAHAAGRLLGLLAQADFDASAEMDGTEYTPVVRIEIAGQTPIWVRVLDPDR